MPTSKQAATPFTTYPPHPPTRPPPSVSLFPRQPVSLAVKTASTAPHCKFLPRKKRSGVKLSDVDIAVCATLCIDDGRVWGLSRPCGLKTRGPFRRRGRGGGRSTCGKSEPEKPPLLYRETKKSSFSRNSQRGCCLAVPTYFRGGWHRGDRTPSVVGRRSRANERQAPSAHAR